VPELPEVEALALDLKGRLADRAIAKVHVVAINALKTFDPPVQALEGTLVEDVTRHGKFLDIETSGLHLILHLARGGWVRWRNDLPPVPPRPNQKSGLAVRVILDDESGMDITEMGTKKRLAMYVVRQPLDVPGIASLGPDPLDDAFTIDVLSGILQKAGRSQIKGVLRHQGTIAGIGNAYSDELLHAAKMSPFKPANSLTADELDRLFAAVKDELGDAVARSRGLAASELKSEKKTRHQLGRDGFLKAAWEWKEQYGGLIFQQERRLGITPDWKRERFTLDEGYSRAVLHVFKALYDEGLVYRGRYIVNWCPRCRTALSDEEVDMVETDGHLWHIRYPLKDGSGGVTVATTRPETMLGDTGVAVNPKDARYAKRVYEGYGVYEDRTEGIRHVPVLRLMPKPGGN